METSYQNKQNQQLEEMLSMRDILDVFIYNWKWFILSAIVCLALGRLYLSTKPRIYKRSAVMLVKDDGGASAGTTRAKTGTDALMQLNGVMMGTSIKNEVYILQSHMIMKDVVRQLHLDVIYGFKDGLQDITLYDVKPFTATFDTIETQWPYAFTVEVNGREARLNQFETLDGKLDFEVTAKLGQPVKTPVGVVTLNPVEASLSLFDGKKVRVTHTTIEQAADRAR